MTTLRESEGYSARLLIREFSNKNWKQGAIENVLRNLRETGWLDCLTGSSRPHTSRSCYVTFHKVS